MTEKKDKEKNEEEKKKLNIFVKIFPWIVLIALIILIWYFKKYLFGINQEDLSGELNLIWTAFNSLSIQEKIISILSIGIGIPLIIYIMVSKSKIASISRITCKNIFLYILIPGFVFVFFLLGVIQAKYPYPDALQQNLTMTLGTMGTPFYHLYEIGKEEPNQWIFILIVFAIGGIHVVITNTKEDWEEYKYREIQTLIGEDLSKFDGEKND